MFTPQRIWQLAVFGQVFNQYHILVLSNSEWERFCPILLWPKHYCYLNISAWYQCLKYSLLSTFNHPNFRINLLQLLRGPSCESSGEWIFLINLVFGEWLEWRSAVLWYLLGTEARVVSPSSEALQIISKIRGPDAVALLETEELGDEVQFPPAHHLSGKMWRSNSGRFVVKEYYKPYSYLGKFPILFQSKEFLILFAGFWSWSKALLWIFYKAALPCPRSWQPLSKQEATTACVERRYSFC